MCRKYGRIILVSSRKIYIIHINHIRQQEWLVWTTWNFLLYWILLNISFSFSWNVTFILRVWSYKVLYIYWTGTTQLGGFFGLDPYRFVPRASLRIWNARMLFSKVSTFVGKISKSFSSVQTRSIVLLDRWIIVLQEKNGSTFAQKRITEFLKKLCTWIAAISMNYQTSSGRLVAHDIQWITPESSKIFVDFNFHDSPAPSSLSEQLFRRVMQLPKHR